MTNFTQPCHGKTLFINIYKFVKISRERIRSCKYMLKRNIIQSTSYIKFGFVQFYKGIFILNHNKIFKRVKRMKALTQGGKASSFGIQSQPL